MKSWQIENCITIIAIAVSVVGLYSLGAGGHSFWMLALLINLSSRG